MADQLLAQLLLTGGLASWSQADWSLVDFGWKPECVSARVVVKKQQPTGRCYTAVYEWFSHSFECALQLTDDITKCSRCEMSQGLSSVIGIILQNEKNVINVSTSKGKFGFLMAFLYFLLTQSEMNTYFISLCSLKVCWRMSLPYCNFTVSLMPALHNVFAFRDGHCVINCYHTVIHYCLGDYGQP